MKRLSFSRLSLIVGLALCAVVIWAEIIPSSANAVILRGSRTYKPLNASIGDYCKGVLESADCDEYDSSCLGSGIPCKTSGWPTNGCVECESQSSTCSGVDDCLDYCDCKCAIQ